MPSMNSTDYFLYIEDSKGDAIDGSAIDEECVGWIPIESFQWDSDGGTKVLTVSLESDRSSPNLMAKLLLADALKKVVFREYRKAGLQSDQSGDGNASGSQLQLEIQLGDAYITGWSISMSMDTGYENMTIVPKRYTVEEFETNPQTGDTTGVSATGWDYQINETITSVDSSATAPTTPASVESETESAAPVQDG